MNLKKLETSQTIASLAFAAITTFIFNFSFIQNKLSLSINNFHDFAIFFLGISFEYFAIFTLLFFASYKKFIFRIILFLIAILCGVSSYAFNKYAVHLNQSTIANLFDNLTNFGEIISIKSVILYVIIFVILPFILLEKINFKQQKNSQTIYFIAIFFIIFTIIFSFFNHGKRKEIISAYQPLSLVKSSLQYYLNFKNKPKLLSISNIIVAKKSPQKIDNLKIVLIIGESARAKNFSINNYPRKTTPKIEEIRNFLNFKNVAPCSNLTAYSVSCMLSYKTAKNFESPPKEESIIKIFDYLNFNTSYFSTQKAFGDDNALISLASQAKQFYFADKIANKIGAKTIYDEYLLDDLERQLSSSGDDFIILHTLGSHFLFHERYSEKFKIFTPTCEERDLTKCSREQIINSYDNSILYTDFFIDSVIKKLQRKNAILIYLSDHGQFLGENNIYYHGPQNSIYNDEHQVSMFLWMSDNLLKNNFYHQKFYRAREKINNNLSHDNLFDSLLDCAGIDYDKNDLSVCK